VVVTGVATKVCVESTLRNGDFNRYYIVLPEDCIDSVSLFFGVMQLIRSIFKKYKLTA
jgi:nicotinamidase-related amidase